MKQVYNIHDNGNIPFVVEIINNEVNIFLSDSNISFLKFDAKDIFIGESPKNKMTTFSCGHGPDFIGNSILIELDTNKYEFIGSSIFSFSTLTKIIDFISPVGNNDVPYPYAVDVDGNIYLMIENVVLKNHPQLSELLKVYDDPYSYYYSTNTIGTFYINGDAYNLLFCAFPDKDYDGLIKRIGERIYTIDSINNNKVPLKKDEYVKIINNYGALKSFEAFENFILVDVKKT